MNKRHLLVPAAAGAIVAALVPVAHGVDASPSQTTAALVAAPRPPATPRLHAVAHTAVADPVVATLRQRYRTEVSGSVAHTTLSRLAHEPGLLAAVRSHSTARVRSYVNSRFQPVWYHWHVSRLRITSGNTTLVETGVPFVIPGPTATLRDARGHALARLQISIQDVIGYVKLNTRHNHVVTVVRGQGAGHVRTSLPAALNVKLPAAGHVTIGGRRYSVHSFNETGWLGEPLRIWILR
jgi:hypothetical protein